MHPLSSSLVHILEKDLMLCKHQVCQGLQESMYPAEVDSFLETITKHVAPFYQKNSWADASV